MTPQIISVPQILFQLPDTAVLVPGPQGIQGPPGLIGQDGPQGAPGPQGPAAATERGTWTPSLQSHGGGNTGQQYQYQQGIYRARDGECTCWGYLQFSNLGTFMAGDSLILAGLPKPTANVPMFFAGICSYFSNPQPGAPQTFYLRTNGGANYAMIDGLPQSGNNPPLLVPSFINPHTQMVFYFHYATD